MTATVTPIRKGRAKPPPEVVPDQPSEEPARPKPILLDPTDKRLELRSLPLSSIVTGANPRIESDIDRDRELNASVKLHGVISPILVRPLEDSTYEVIAGSRRFSAAKAAKLDDIPVVVTSAPDLNAYVLSLVENLQREDLSPIDEAKALAFVLDMPKPNGKKMTQGELAKEIGRSQPYVSNSIRLLTLPDEVIEKVQSGEVSVGAAKALITLPKEQQTRLAKETVKKRLTAGQVESEARYERQKEERAQADKAKEAKALKAYVAAAKEVEDGTTILVYGESVAKALRKRSIPTEVFSNQTHTLKNGRIPCDCKGALIEVTQYSDPMVSKISDVCLVREHVTKVRDEEQRKETEEHNRQITSVNEARKQAVPVVISGFDTDTPGLTDMGLRFFLYTLLAQPLARSDYDRDRNAVNAFRLHHEKPTEDNLVPLMTGIWPIILRLSSKEIIEELIGFGFGMVFDNVYADTARQRNASHAPLRQWFVDTHGLEPTIVWGGHEPIVFHSQFEPMTVHEFVPDEAWEIEVRSQFDPGDDTLDEAAVDALFHAEYDGLIPCEVCADYFDDEPVVRADHDKVMASLAEATEPTREPVTEDEPTETPETPDEAPADEPEANPDSEDYSASSV